MGAKSLTWTPEMQRNVVLNDKLVYTMQKQMVSVSTVNVILEHRGVHTKLVRYTLLLILDH